MPLKNDETENMGGHKRKGVRAGNHKGKFKYVKREPFSEGAMLAKSAIKGLIH